VTGRGNRGARPRRWLVGLYPADWRDRYGDEYLALLEQLPLTPRVVADHARAALAAHLDPGRETTATRAEAAQLRGGELAVLIAWLALVVGGLAFQRMIDDGLLQAAGADNLAVRLAGGLVATGAVVSLLAVLAGALPVVIAIVWTALADRRPGLIALLAVPPILFALWLSFTVWLAGHGPAPMAGDERAVLLSVWAGSFVAALVVGWAAVSVAAATSSVPLACYRFALRPSYVVAASTALILASVAGWGAAVASLAPDAFWGDQGLLASSTALSWLGVLVVMAGAAGVAVRAALGLRRLARLSPA
jgi:hypothetical protein